MLSKRLEAVASFVPDEVRMADIGCDHAYLPIALLERKRVTHAIGCDINEGPLEAARKNAARADVDLSVLDLRLGDGLSALSPGEVDVVTLAGMGAGLMVDILSAQPDVVAQLQRIVVSPNVAPWLLRRWGMENGFAVGKEMVVYDNGHFYEVFTLEHQPMAFVYSEIDLYFGIALRTQCDDVTRAYFEERWKNDERLLDAWAPLVKSHRDLAVRYERLLKLWDGLRSERSCE